MEPVIYQEITTYSPLVDNDVTRISTVDERNGEYFSLIRRPPSARMWRTIKGKVLDDLEAVLALSPHERPEPGEVPVGDQMWQG